MVKTKMTIKINLKKKEKEKKERKRKNNPQVLKPKKKIFVREIEKNCKMYICMYVPWIQVIFQNV